MAKTKKAPTKIAPGAKVTAGAGKPLCRIVSVGSVKGGTGKSTLSLGLALFAAARGRRALYLDVDFAGTRLLDAFGGIPWQTPTKGKADDRPLNDALLRHDGPSLEEVAHRVPGVEVDFFFSSLDNDLVRETVHMLAIEPTHRILSTRLDDLLRRHLAGSTGETVVVLDHGPGILGLSDAVSSHRWSLLEEGGHRVESSLVLVSTPDLPDFRAASIELARLQRSPLVSVHAVLNKADGVESDGRVARDTTSRPAYERLAEAVERTRRLPVAVGWEARVAALLQPDEKGHGRATLDPYAATTAAAFGRVYERLLGGAAP